MDRTLRHVGLLLGVGISVLPVLFVAHASMTADDGSFSLRDYGVLGDTRVYVLLVRSAGIALGGAISAFLIGGPVAAVLETRRVPLRGLLRWTAFLPLALPPFAHVLVWERLAASTGFSLTALRQSPLACCLALGVSYSPLAFYFVSEALHSLSAELVDAARVALSPLRVWARVVLPLSLPVVTPGFLLVFVLAFLNFEIPDLLEIPTYPVEITLHQGADEAGRAFALAVPAALLALVLLLTARFWISRRGFALVGGETQRSLASRPAGWLPWAALSVWWLATVIVPAGTLATTAGSSDVMSRVFSESWEHLLLGDLLPLAAAVASTAVAALLARPGKARLAEMVLWVPFVLPSALLSVGVLRLWNRPLLAPVFDSPLLFVLGGVARWFPLAYFVLRAHLSAVPTEQWDAEKMVRGGHRSAWRTLLRVRAPLAAPGLVLATLVVFLLQSGELPMAIQLQHPGMAPSTVRVYSLIHFLRESEVAALTLWHSAMVLVGVGALLVIGRCWTRRRTETSLLP